MMRDKKGKRRANDRMTEDMSVAESHSIRALQAGLMMAVLYINWRHMEFQVY